MRNPSVLATRQKIPRKGVRKLRGTLRQGRRRRVSPGLRRGDHRLHQERRGSRRGGVPRAEKSAGRALFPAVSLKTPSVACDSAARRTGRASRTPPPRDTPAFPPPNPENGSAAPETARGEVEERERARAPGRASARLERRSRWCSSPRETSRNRPTRTSRRSARISPTRASPPVCSLAAWTPNRRRRRFAGLRRRRGTPRGRVLDGRVRRVESLRRSILRAGRGGSAVGRRQPGRPAASVRAHAAIRPRVQIPSGVALLPPRCIRPRFPNWRRRCVANRRGWTSRAKNTSQTPCITPCTS